MSNFSTPPTLPRVRWIDSVGTRLVLLVVGSLVLLSAVTAWYTLHTASEAWDEVVEQCGLRMGENILAATYLGMLANHKEDVQYTIDKLEQGPAVHSIRIYDKHGRIAFSGDRAEVGTQADMSSAPCMACHDQDVVAQQATRSVRAADGSRLLDISVAIPSSPECSNAACHAHPEPDVTLGSLDIRLSQASADASLVRMWTVVVVGTLIMVLIMTLATSVQINRLVQVPVRRLISGTERVAHGDLTGRVEVNSKGELRVLAEAFDRMTEDLRFKSEELERTREHLVHVEKMTSLGKLTATVAHEINNPLSGILTYAKLSARVLQPVRADMVRELGEEETEGLFRYLDLIVWETARCGQIVQNLLVFSREVHTSLAEHDLGEIVERAIMVVRHHIEVTGVVLVGDECPQGVTLVCDGHRIQQALVALLMNAVESMDEGGKLGVECTADEDEVRIAISDEGIGIPADVLPRIYEPFFSTKEDQKGVGLGLAVVYGIVRRHGGSVEVESVEGQGSTFLVRLPRDPSGSDPTEGEAS